MANRIRKDDIVKIISGKYKNTTGKVLSVNDKGAYVEGVGMRTRHIRPNQLNPRGGKKDIQVPVSLHKLALVTDSKTAKTSRVGYNITEDGNKIRVARQQNNKEIK